VADLVAGFAIDFYDGVFLGIRHQHRVAERVPVDGVRVANERHRILFSATPDASRLPRARALSELVVRVVEQAAVVGHVDAIGETRDRNFLAVGAVERALEHTARFVAVVAKGTLFDPDVLAVFGDALKRRGRVARRVRVVPNHSALAIHDVEPESRMVEAP
jgi:hypothetical protein